MKEIHIKFLTKNGEAAYNKIEAEGKKKNWAEREIIKKVFKQYIYNHSPLEVKIEVKREKVALMIDIEGNIKKALKDNGALEGKDYTLECL